MKYVAEEIGDQIEELQTKLDEIKDKHGDVISIIWRDSLRTFVVVYEYDDA